MKNLSFKDYIVYNKNGSLRVVWEWIGEGHESDYNEDDPDDEPLLRFSCDKIEDGEWVGMDNASYCTQLNIKTPKKYLKQGAKEIIDAIEHESYKRRLEELSWLCIEDFKGKV